MKPKRQTVVTYRRCYGYLPSTIDLCARHAASVAGLGEVQHGRHYGRCDECAAQAAGEEEELRRQITD